MNKKSIRTIQKDCEICQKNINAFYFVASHATFTQSYFSYFGLQQVKVQNISLDCAGSKTVPLQLKFRSSNKQGKQIKS